MPDQSLFSKTPPNSPGWYCWRPGPERRNRTAEIVLVESINGGELVMFRVGYSAAMILHGEWGPRCYLPSAPPVECVCPNCHGASAIGEWAIPCVVCKGTGRGVFIPLAEEPQSWDTHP